MLSFWSFCYERQRIWKLRNTGKPGPWTDDQILARKHFTNIQRELDRGTQMLLRGMMKHGATAPPAELVANSMLYRWLRGNTDLYEEAFGGWVSLGQMPAACQFLRGMVRMRSERARGVPTVFGRAGQPPTGHSRTISPEERLALFSQGLLEELAQAVASVAAMAGSLAEVHAVLPKRDEPYGGFGPFLSMQVTLDCVYIFPHLSDDEWVYIGGGINTSKRDGGLVDIGPRVILLQLAGIPQGAAALRDQELLLGLLEQVRDVQDERFKAAGLDWADVAWHAKPRLSLADLEHGMCEYDKYQRGGPSRNFMPHQEMKERR